MMKQDKFDEGGEKKLVETKGCIEEKSKTTYVKNAHASGDGSFKRSDEENLKPKETTGTKEEDY